MEDQQRVCVRNTFIHIDDVGSDGVKVVSRSQSDNSLSTSSKSGRSDLPPVGGPEVARADDHHVFSESSDSRPSNSSGDHSNLYDGHVHPGTNDDTYNAGAPDSSEPHSGFDKTSDKSLVTTGSALHDVGQCAPCVWFWRSKGCENGVGCNFCHMCREGELAIRRKNRMDYLKDKRAKIKERKQAIRAVRDAQPHTDAECDSLFVNRQGTAQPPGLVSSSSSAYAQPAFAPYAQADASLPLPKPVGAISLPKPVGRIAGAEPPPGRKPHNRFSL